MEGDDHMYIEQQYDPGIDPGIDAGRWTLE